MRVHKQLKDILFTFPEGYEKSVFVLEFADSGRDNELRLFALNKLTGAGISGKRSYLSQSLNSKRNIDSNHIKQPVAAVLLS